MQTIQTIENSIKNNRALMVYFSAPTCSVCHSLKPKLMESLEKNFKEFVVESVDISTQEEIAPHFGVFAIPTVLIFLHGKEFVRKSRHMSVEELVREIERPYSFLIDT